MRTETKWGIILATILFLLFVIVLIIKNGNSLQNKYKECQKNLSFCKSTQSLKHTTDILTEWVYEHSTKISRKTASEIVIETLKTKDPIFFLSLFEVESNFDPNCVSKLHAIGLGQVMPLHKEELIKAGIIKEVRDIFNIAEGIKASGFVWDIKWKEGRGDIRKALAKYLGESNKNYSDKVLENYFHLSTITKRIPMGNQLIKGE
jgi:hypothetical protein